MSIIRRKKNSFWILILILLLNSCDSHDNIRQLCKKYVPYVPVYLVDSAKDTIFAMVPVYLNLIVALIVYCGCNHIVGNRNTEQGYSLNKRIQIQADTIWEMPDLPLLDNMKILYDDKIIFIDSTTTYIPNTPKIIYYTDDIFYLILTFFDPTTQCNNNVFQYENGFCKKLKEEVATGLIADIDNDGIIELVSEDWHQCTNETCDSCSYAPFEVYRVGGNFVLDTFLSNKLTRLKYGFIVDHPNYLTKVKCGKRIAYKNIPMYIQGKNFRNQSIEIHRINK